MGKIIILDENTANKIAAGEVVERPASVVKELIENSIDAGANKISVEIKNGGISYLKVSDNGCGISEDDSKIAFERHATSKIRAPKDLESISTLGFRGEALSSIAAVSSTELTTRPYDKPYGTFVKIRGGNILDVKQVGCPVGTTFVIKDLFYNTPARYKFLKKDSTEAGYISDILSRISLGNPQISFKFINKKNIELHTPGNGDLKSTIFSIYGSEISKSLIKVCYDDNNIKIDGYIGKPDIARANKSFQSIYINQRYIKSKLIQAAIDEAYKTILLRGKFPFIVLHIVVNPMTVDVNVHPTKTEVRFQDEQLIFRSIHDAVSNALLGISLIPDTKIKEEKKEQKKEAVKEAVKEVVKEVVKEKPEIYKIERKQEPQEVLKVEEKKLPDKFVQPVKEKKIDIFNKMPIEPQKKDIFKNAKIIGQVFNTYILLEESNDFILIDQHAAHERIMYHSLYKKYHEKQNLSQTMLVPLVISITNMEKAFLLEKKEFFSKVGYIYEDFGNTDIVIRAVPIINSKSSLKDAFLEILDFCIKSYKDNDNNFINEMLYKLSCKSAIKANDKLCELDIKSILDKLNELDNPYTCLHGRPTIIKITKHELEKMFKRSV